MVKLVKLTALCTISILFSEYDFTFCAARGSERLTDPPPFLCESNQVYNITSHQAGGNWIDLTYAFDNSTIYWPTADQFTLESEYYGRTESGFFYSANHISASEHGGTHIDAPIHFIEGGQSVDDIPLDTLTGWATIVDISHKALKDPDYLISGDDIIEWEKRSSVHLGEHVIVLLHTGYGSYWPNATAYLGTSKRGPDALESLHFPGLSGAAAKLLSKRGVKAVGIDTASIDYGQSASYDAHIALLEKGVVIFENVANLGQLLCDTQVSASRNPESQNVGRWSDGPAKIRPQCPQFFYVISLPMKIRNGTGAPLRMIAWNQA